MMDAAALEQLLAKQAITEKIHDYCRAMDRIDDDLGRSVFHPEAEADYGDMFRGTGYGFIDFVHQSHERMFIHAHQIGNVSIAVDGDRAGSEAYVTATLRMRAPEGGVLEIRSQGRYVDRWLKRDGAWRIIRRQYLHAFDETRPVPESEYASGGARDRTDPSYAALGA